VNATGPQGCGILSPEDRLRSSGVGPHHAAGQSMPGERTCLVQMDLSCTSGDPRFVIPRPHESARPTFPPVAHCSVFGTVSEQRS